MAHFALVGDDNIVITTVVVSNDDCGGGEYPDSEPIGAAFLSAFPNAPTNGRWLQTSYNHNFRGVYGAPGYIYDEELDVFMPPEGDTQWAEGDTPWLKGKKKG